MCQVSVYRTTGPLVKCFYHIWTWWPSWSCDLNHLQSLLFPYPMKALQEIWFHLAVIEEKNCQRAIQTRDPEKLKNNQY